MNTVLSKTFFKMAQLLDQSFIYFMYAWKLKTGKLFIFSS